MKILQVTYTYSHLPETGGPAFEIHAISEGLAQRGHGVTVLTIGNPQTANESVQTGAKTIYLRSWFKYRTMAFVPGALLFCLMRLKNFDVVQIYGLYEMLGPLVAAFCRLMRVPYILEPLGMNRPVGRSLWKKRLYHFILGRRLISGATVLIATSIKERTWLVEDGISAENIVVRRNGIHISEFRPLPKKGGFRAANGIAEETKLVMFLGRLAPIKNLEALLIAFASLNQTDTQLVLVGPIQETTYIDRLKTLGEKLNISDKVLFSGPRYGREKVDALVDADVFVLPSIAESFGISALEAMACGVPVVVTQNCGIADYVDGRAGVVVSNDSSALCAGIMGMLDSPAAARKYGMQGIEVAKGLSWDEPVADTERIYERILRGFKST